MLKTLEEQRRVTNNGKAAARVGCYRRHPHRDLFVRREQYFPRICAIGCSMLALSVLAEILRPTSSKTKFARLVDKM